MEEDLGVTVVRLANAPRHKGGALLNARRLKRAIRDIDAACSIDVVEAPEAGLALLSSDSPGLRVIRMHGGHHFFAATLGRSPRIVRAWLEKRSFARAHALCAVSDFVATTTRELLQLRNAPIEVLPNPVETDLFDVQSGISEKAASLLFVGTVCEKKGIRQLLEAMPAILAAVPTAHLRVAGRDSKTPKGRSYVESLKARLTPAVAARVVFLGQIPRPDLPRLMAEASVCVYPSHMEAMALTLVEALAMGKPIVASRTGPGPEVIEDGVTGVLCNPQDPSSIAAGVIKLLQDPAARMRLARHARARAVRLYSITSLVERNERFYRECVNRQRVSHA